MTQTMLTPQHPLTPKTAEPVRMTITVAAASSFEPGDHLAIDGGQGKEYLLVLGVMDDRTLDVVSLPWPTTWREWLADAWREVCHWVWGLTQHARQWHTR